MFSKYWVPTVCFSVELVLGGKGHWNPIPFLLNKKCFVLFQFCFSFSFVSKKGAVTLFSPGAHPHSHWLKYSSLHLNNLLLPPPCPAQYCLLENFNTLLLDSVSCGRAEPQCQVSCPWTRTLLWSLYPRDKFLDQESGFSLIVLKNYL